MKCPYCGKNLEIVGSQNIIEKKKKPKKEKKQKKEKNKICKFKYNENAKCENMALEGKDFCELHNG